MGFNERRKVITVQENVTFLGHQQFFNRQLIVQLYFTFLNFYPVLDPFKFENFVNLTNNYDWYNVQDDLCQYHNNETRDVKREI